MDKETYERQKAFAGEKKPSMKRRFVGHDYTRRSMYMVTMETEGRRPLLGQVVGRSDAPSDSAEAPRTVLSKLGQLVASEWETISSYHSEISVVALQIMPDHLHGILFVKRAMQQPLGIVLRGFKQSCNKHYRELVLGRGSVGSDMSVALPTQQTGNRPVKKDRRGEDRSHGMLFARGYNDSVLLRDGQLGRWLHYLEDNPRRLLMKREKPEWLRPFFNFAYGTHVYSGVGNRALLNAPQRLAVRISRRLTETQLKTEVERYLEAARHGAVLISPAISPGEKLVMRQAFDLHLPTIVIMENGFQPLSKPHGEQFYACSEGRLLMLSAWEHHNERRPLTAYQCQQMNLMALELSSGA